MRPRASAVGCCIAATSALLCAGCARGNATLQIASLNYRSIDPPAARVMDVRASGCYWWTDDADRVWVAFERRFHSLLIPQLNSTFQFSLMLEKLPAGHARNYEARREELRARVRTGPFEIRFVSRQGIVALYRERGDRIRGHFRLQVLREVSRLLGGWGRPAQYLMIGRFNAVHDEKRGRAIAEATESLGFDRKTPADTQPASRIEGGVKLTNPAEN